MPQSDLTGGIVAASMPFIIKIEVVVPRCYLALLGVLHLFTHLGIVTVSMGHIWWGFDNQVLIWTLIRSTTVHYLRAFLILPEWFKEVQLGLKLKEYSKLTLGTNQM